MADKKKDVREIRIVEIAGVEDLSSIAGGSVCCNIAVVQPKVQKKK
jgi:hypothetical protein